MTSSRPSPSAPASIASLRLEIDNTLRLERAAFAAKVRASRAVLMLSQDQLAARLGLTQKSVHRIEQGAVDPKMRTLVTIQQFWRDSGIGFEDLPDGGFRLVIKAQILRR